MHGPIFAIACAVLLAPCANSQILITLFDSAGLRPAHFQSLTWTLRRILDETGVEARVVACLRGNRPTGEPECRATAVRNEVMIRIVTPSRQIKPGVVGWTAVSPEGVHYLTLYLHPTRRLEGQGLADPGTLFGHAAAHEIGHLFLRTADHAPSGLMKSTWKQSDHLDMLAGRLRFSPEQAQAIRESLR